MKNRVHKIIKLHEATKGEITLDPRFITLIKPVPFGSTPFEFGAKTFIAYRSDADIQHHYVTEEIAEMML